MLLIILCATAAFLFGYAVAIRTSRRGLQLEAMRAAVEYEALERHLARIGAGVGVGA